MKYCFLSHINIVTFVQDKRLVNNINVNEITDRSRKTQVVTQLGETGYFPIEVGLHQGSAPGPLSCSL